MKKNQQKLATDCKESIAGVINEFLDWKDVYASQLKDEQMGAVLFAANFSGDVFIEWRLVDQKVKVGDKTHYGLGSDAELDAKFVWIDKE